MGSVQNFYTSRDNNTDPATYVGQLDRLWYNPVTNSIFVSNGNTPGGVPVALATGANIVADNIALNSITARTGNITITGDIILTGSANIAGNISPAAPGKIGGIQPGPGVVVANDGTLTFDTANLPLSFGNFTASNNVLKIVNSGEDMILQTEGSAEIQLIGNIGFYRPDGIPPDVGNRYFWAKDDGQIFIYVPVEDSANGAVDIIGSTTGATIPPGQPGAMLHITGQLDVPSRVYVDGNSDYVSIVGRRWNGNVANPTQVLAGEDVLRINATAATNAGMPNQAIAQIFMAALEDQTTTAQGSKIAFVTTPVGDVTANRVEVANVTVANGVAATKFTTAGTMSAAGNITGGNLTAVSSVTAPVISAVGNVVGGNITTVGQVSAVGNITTSGYFIGNAAFASGINAFGNVYANGVAILATSGSSSLTLTPGNNIVITGDNGLKSATVAVVSSPSFTGNVTAGNLLTNGAVSAAGNITGGNLSGTNIAGTLTTAGQPNITAVGTLTSLSVTGNVAAGNVSGTNGVFTNLTGTLTTASQPNITSVGNLGSLSVTGNVSAGNISASGTFTAGTFSTTGNVISGNITGYVTLSAGTANVAPLVFTAGTVTTIPTVGAMNYDGRVFYSTPQDSERGLMRSVQTYILNADYNLNNQTGIQSMFGVGTTVSTNTRYAYAINAVIYKTTNNITLGFALAGNAAFTRHTLQAITSGTGSLGTVTAASIYKNIITTGFDTPVVVTGSLNGTGYFSVQITGIINVVTGGTWIPQVAFSGLPGAGSYTAIASSCEIWPIGAGNTTVSIGNWS